MTAGGVEQYVILAFSSKEGQEKCTSFAILSLTLGPGDAYDPAALGRLGPGGAMTLRSARGLVALAVVFASIGAGFWLHAIWTTRRGPEPSVKSHGARTRSEEHTSELQSQSNLVCRLLL